MSRTTTKSPVSDVPAESVVLPETDNQPNSDVLLETGTPDWSGISTETVEAYKSADSAKSRASVRKSAQTAMESAIDSMDAHQALYWKRTLAALTVKSDEADKVAADPADVLNVRIASLVGAAKLLANGSSVPEGLNVENVDYSRFADIQTVLTELYDSFGESVQSDEANSSVKLAESKITRSSEKHDIGDVVRRAFADAESGDALKLSEVSRLGRLDDYKPSAGAIAARWLTGAQRGVEGFTYLPTSADGPAMIRKD